MYAIHIDPKTNRILFDMPEWAAAEGDIKVDEVPERCIDYLYINGEYIYDPLPSEPEEPDPIEVLQQQVAKLTEQVKSLQQIVLKLLPEEPITEE